MLFIAHNSPVTCDQIRAQDSANERAGPEDEVIKCTMPLTTGFAELDEGKDILEQAMALEFGAAKPAMAESA
jgi:4-aminobutyrate aminotransferase-like enzyme